MNDSYVQLKETRGILSIMYRISQQCFKIMDVCMWTQSHHLRKCKEVLLPPSQLLVRTNEI